MRMLFFMVILCGLISGCANFQPLRQYPKTSEEHKGIYLKAYKDGVITQSQMYSICKLYDDYPTEEANIKAVNFIKEEGKLEGFRVWVELKKEEQEEQKEQNNIISEARAQTGLQDIANIFLQRGQPAKPKKAYIYRQFGTKYDTGALVVEEE